jgi:hypothetical protein
MNASTRSADKLRRPELGFIVFGDLDMLLGNWGQLKNSSFVEQQGW